MKTTTSKNVKNLRFHYLIYGLLILPAIMGCSVNAEEDKETGRLTYRNPTDEFKEYWYSGKAELSHYDLEQVRYGEIHKGDAVLIFVSEDFLEDQQVKYEYGEKDNVASVLKLNFTRKFNTGIYPYSMMSSVFTPISTIMPSLKVSTTSQEWCGHTFSQLNYSEGQYRGQLYSYFQAEGDQEIVLDAVLLEDEIWNIIRVDPDELPKGNIKLIPGTQFQRFKHMEFKVENALASIQALEDSTGSSKPMLKYRIEYKDLDRILEITYTRDFPHTIEAWEEQMVSGFDDPKILTTRAIRTHTMKGPYWSQNSVADSLYRKELGL